MESIRTDIMVGSLGGATATLAMDAAGILGRRLGLVPKGDIGTGQLGRWIGYMSKGKFKHDRLSTELPLPKEDQLGLTAHYLIGMLLGVGYMRLLRASGGRPRIKPALAYGIATTVLPWLVVYPAYGLGWFGLKTGDKRLMRTSLGGHAVYGLSLGIVTAVMRRRSLHVALRC